MVVLIIGITAALATPGMTTQIRERRSRDVAQRIAQLYSGARMRALGRGTAVLVRYRTTGFTVLESIQGVAAATAQNATSAACANQAGLGCLANAWGNPAVSRLVSDLTPSSEITVTPKNQGGTTVTQMDICFSPAGRSFVSFDGTPPTTPMVGATTVDVQRTGNGTGLLRTVAVLPNGMARLGL